MAKLEDQVRQSMDRNSGMQVSDPGPDHSVSFPSKGPVLNENGQQITNDHSILTDVNGKETWLHHLFHHHADGRVHMPLSHATDMGLTDKPEPQGADALSPGSQQKETTDQQASGVTEQGTDLSPTKPAAPSHLANKDEDDKRTKMGKSG